MTGAESGANRIAFTVSLIWWGHVVVFFNQWLMQNDFKPEPGATFSMAGNWGTVDCEVLTNEEARELSYTWEAYGLERVVTWTLTPTAAGTRLRMEQSGFKPDQNQAYGGAKGGWAMFFDNLERVLVQD